MTARRALTLTVLLVLAAAAAWSQGVTISPASLPVAGGQFSVGHAIPSQQLVTNFPNDPTSWSVSAGTFPPGLNLDSAGGVITGTPTLAGAFTFTILAVDLEISAQGSRQYTIFVNLGSPLSLTPVGHPAAAAGSFYLSQSFQVGGGVPGYTWALQTGTNADGLTINAGSGLLSGVPQAGGDFAIGVVVTDASGGQVSAPFNLNVLGISTASLPNGTVGVPYAQTLAAVGGSGSFVWSPSGTLPPGLSLSAQGQIAGTPTASGTFPFQAVVTDSVTNLSSSRSFSITIPAALTITTTSLPAGAIGVNYSQTLAATGSTGTLTWSLSSGTPPPGLNLSAQGQITGTPTKLGTFAFEVGVTDSVLSATQSLSITITSALTVTSTSPLPSGTVGIAYSQTLQASGGTAPYSWNATGLPAGLALDSATGVLSGTPTATGTSIVSVTVTDAARGTANAQLTLTIGALTISPATLPAGFVNVAYSVALTVSGNPAPLTWNVAVGALPAGLNINSSTGVISGTPTSAGSSTFTISATLGAVASVIPPVLRQFTLVISGGPTITITGLPATGVAATQPAAAVSLTGGTYPLDITGTMTLTFAPGAGDAKFATGPPTTATFTVPAGATQGLFGAASSVPVMIGTVAGTITITTALRDATGNPLPPPAPTVITVNATVPVITKVTPGAVTAGAFSLAVTGRSTPRDMTSALFHFTLPTNTQPTTVDVTVPLTSAFTAWYSSAASNPFGSTFTMTVPFTFTGPPGTTVPYTAVTVTMTNSVGTSTVFGPVSP